MTKKVFNCLLNWQRLSDDCSEAGSLFQSRGPATSNDLSPRRVLDHGMTHVMAPDERRRRLASDADLHASERYDGVQQMSHVIDRCASHLVDTPCQQGVTFNKVYYTSVYKVWRFAVNWATGKLGNSKFGNHFLFASVNSAMVKWATVNWSTEKRSRFLIQRWLNAIVSYLRYCRNWENGDWKFNNVAWITADNLM